MDVKEKIKALRDLMAKRNLDAYIVPSSDAHQSEYVADHWQARSWLSGFTGSAGTVVITNGENGLWTDGRYYIQAELQLKGSGIKLFKMNEPGVPGYIDWLAQILPEGAKVGFDGKVFSRSSVKKMEKKFAKKNIDIEGVDLIAEIWKDRPEIPSDPIYLHEEPDAGRSVGEKMALVREKMAEKEASYFLLTSLDDIAWVFNIRGTDVSNNPVAIAYALITDKRAYLFIEDKKVPQEVKKYFKDNDIVLKPYDAIVDSLSKLQEGKQIYLDPARTNNWLYQAVPPVCSKIEGRNFTTDLKAVKSEAELENYRRCEIRDGVAMIKFLYWLDKNLKSGKITEISASDKLAEFRSRGEKFKGLSFDTIAAYKEHAAMMHYKATAESDYTLKEEGMLLVDSGGQYLDGTTDITRTIILGKISEEEKHDFTLTLKGHIALAQAKFLYGATGSNLDILARRPLWEEGIDYKCGTGHGVGYFLNVHEGPQNFSQAVNKVKIEPGMVTTDEPGVYKEGCYGIRIENILVAKEVEKTEFGQFMAFETVSYCPIDLEGIDKDMLTEKEISWLNNYHQKVYELLSPYLGEEEKDWLKNETRSI